MDAELKIKIGAETQQAEAGIKKVTQALGNLKPGANQATFALTNLSRVAQDAPFGFIGIANNLDPLLNSFQQLKNQTGSVGGAFKALGAGLLGPAGIAVGFSTISSLVVVAIQKYGSLSGAISALLGDTSSLAQANRELATSFTEAQGKVGGEIAAINALIAVARDKSLSDLARGEAIKKLNDQYGTYLPNLNLENIGTQQVTDAVLKLNDALLRQAKIKGVQELIGKEFQKQAEEAVKLKEALENANKPANYLINTLRGGALGGGAGLGLLSNLNSINGSLEESEVRINRFKEVLQQLLSEDATAGTLFKDTPLKVKELRVKPEKIKVEATKDNVDLGDLIKQVGSGAFIKSKFETPEIVPLRVQNNDAFKKYLEDLATARKESLKTAQTITDALTPAFEGFFRALIDGSGNPFKALGDAFKQLIIQIGVAIVKTQLLKAINSGLTSGGGGSGILKFLSSALSGNVGGISNGGINVGGITGAANVGGQKLVAEVSGTSLKFLLDKTNGSIKRGF